METERYVGLNTAKGLLTSAQSESGFAEGRDGVRKIFTMKDGKADFICFADKTLCYVKSASGYPAYYPLKDALFSKPARYVLMDLDGTSVKSERFWMYIIERSVAMLLKKNKFRLSPEDEPFVSGHSVTEHLQYCIDKYSPESSIIEARENYFKITKYEMDEIMAGRGVENAFTPAEGLREFLLELKNGGVKIGLVTSGLFEKAFPEILSAFKTLGMGDPLEFYDAVITAGTALRQGSAGTLGELEPKPHPWLYAETAAVGLGIDEQQRQNTLCIEDSAAGVLSIRLAGFAAAGVEGGNIRAAGAEGLCHGMYENLSDILNIIK